MDNGEKLDFLRKILEGCRLKTSVFRLDEIEKGSEAGLFLEQFPAPSPRVLYRASDSFFCRVLFLMLDSESIFAIGPYLSEDVGEKVILEQCEKNGMSARLTEKIRGYFATLPTLKDDFFVMEALSAFADELWGEDYELQELFRDNFSLFINRSAEGVKGVEGTSTAEATEARYKVENELISMVAQGNLQKAEAMVSSLSSLSFENRISDPLRSIKNYAIIMNTLFRKAAEQGGVHPVFLDGVSSSFAKRIEEIHSTPKVQELMLEMLRTYCRLVKKHSIGDYSLLVQKALLKIEGDLTSDLSLNNMAKTFKVTPSYFSSLFKKETGKTPTEFVNSRRISMAKHLLKTTTLQVQTIAQHCGILDFHYFCRVFKKETGKTPTEYRASYNLV